MKRKIFVLALALCLGCLSACAPETAQTAPSPAAETAGAPATPTPPSSPAPTPTPAPVSVNGQLVPADAEALALTEPVSDPDALREGLLQLKQLKTLSLDRAVPREDIAAWTEAWAALAEELPQVTFRMRDLFEGVPADAVTAFAPSSLPEDEAAELAAILKTFENLKELDLGALAADREQVAALAALAPTVNVRWTDETFGPSESAWETLTLSAPSTADAVKTYLACFPSLQEADIRSVGLTEAEGDALCRAFPQVALRRTVTLNGTALDSFTEELDLSGASIDDQAAFQDALSRFPRLRRLQMHHCSLSNEELAALRDRFPHTKIVWTVKVGKREVSTDAVAFSTQQGSNNKNRLSTARVQALQYCTDLIALDLGHNAIDGLTWLEPLQKLQVLILADNSIRDISPLASLKELKYVELFMNSRLKDITALAALPELLDVNLCITHTEDLSPLLQCTKLERIWIGHQTQKHCTQESLQALLEAFPNAQYDLTSVSCTNRGWREHPRYDAYVQMFRTNVPVAPFLPEG